MRRFVRVILFVMITQLVFTERLLAQSVIRVRPERKADSTPAKEREIEDRKAGAEEQKAQAALRQATADERRAKTEEDKLAIESRQVVITAVSTAVTLLVAFSGLAFSVWSLHRTNAAQVRLKLLELALDNTSANVAVNRVKFAADLFQTGSPSNIDEVRKNVESGAYGSLGRLPTDTQSVRATILALLADHPDLRTQILHDCATLFPTDGWAEPLRRVAVRQDPNG